MADIVTLSDGATTVTLVAGGIVGTGSRAIRIGPIDGTKQTITLEGAQIRGSTVDDALDRYNTLERLLHDAQAFRAQGLGRRVSLTIQADTSVNATTYYVRAGRIPDLPPMPSFLIAQRKYFGPFTVELDVEPFGRGAEVTLINATGTLRSRNHITHRYVHHTGGTVFSVNLTAQTRGPLWQTNKFAAPPTAVTPAAGDILYIGSTLGIFDRVILGISTAAAGITWGAVQYSVTGPAWTTFVPSSNAFLSGANLLGVAASMGEIVLPTLAGWAATLLNGATAFWIRINVTSVSSPTTPVLVNGPIRSSSGVVSITAADVDGDVPALGLIHLKNDGATALAGIRAAIATSQLGNPAPPFSISLLSARTYVPTTGDITAAVGTDAEATAGERAEISLAPSYTDAAQTWDGQTEFATVATISGDKIDTMGGGSFFIEVGFSVDTDVTRPMPLCSRWDPSGSERVFWLGVDDMRLRGMVSTTGDNRITVNGNHRFKARERHMATLEFDSTKRRINLYLDSNLEASTKVPNNTIRRTVAVPLRIAQSVSYSTNDSRNGQDDEDFLDGTTDWVMGYGDRVEDFRADVLGGDDYNFPNDPANEVARSDSAEVRFLYNMNDNVASTVLVDSAVTFAAAKNLARIGNSSTNRRPGVLSGGVGAPTLALSGELPTCLVEEYAGSYRIILMARPAVALGELDDVAFQLQLFVGDSRLQLGPPAYFPNIAVPPSSGYYQLDMGVFTLPPFGLYDGHRGSGSSAQAVSWALFVQHKFTSVKVMYADNLYLLPTDTWCGEYTAFDDHYEAAYAVVQNAGVSWDSRGPRTLVYQTTTGGILVQDRNPYAVPVPSSPRLHPKKSATLFALGLRGDAATDVLYRVISDVFVPTVKAAPRYRALAGS